jgi:DinB superfamily
MIVEMRTMILLGCIACATLSAQNNMTNAAVQRYFNPIRRNLEASAEVMPAEKYGFRLTPGQMTFAEWINHSSERNYRDCSTLRSEPQPEALKRLPSLKEKAEVTKELKDSFAYCAAALEKMDDQKAASSPEMSAAFLHVIVHNNEIYGNVVGYLRVSGIVPPSTAAMRSQSKTK